MRRGAQEKRRGTYTSPVSDRDGRPGRDLRAGEISGTAALLDTHAILESIPEPVGLVDRQGRILAFNAAGRHVIFAARTQEVALGDDLFSFISPHNVAGVRESLDRAFSGEAHTHKTEAGGRHFETVYSPVRGPGGDVAAVSIRVADVTRRENAIAELAALNATLEQRVAERGEELRVILSATHDGFALFRPGAWFEDVNEAYCRLVGYSRDELLRMNLRDVEAGLSPERFEELSRRLREEGSVSFESRHRRKDGGVVDIDATVNWENVVGGRFFAFVRDISARKEAEAVRDRQLEILEATPEFVGMADEERRLLYLNPAGRRLVGLDSIDGVRVADLHPPRTFEFLLREVAPASRRGEVWQGESVLKSADGREIPVFQVVVPHLRPDGSLAYSSTVARDISGQKRAEAEREERAAELTRLNADLARAARAKDEFLASMSHELRTPLTGILGAAELLRVGAHGPLNERQLRSLGFLEEAGRHLLALLSDILDLSRIGAERLSLRQEPCSLGEVCESALAIVREDAKRKDLDLSFLGPPAPVRFVADGRRIRQVLVNLLSNAVKFTPAGGFVELSAGADEETELVRLEVRDTGPGIAPEDIPRLFQRFSQLDSRLSREHAGTGLGLALVKSLSELHGGHAEVESEPGKGSLFRVVLPWRRQLARGSGSVPALPAERAPEHVPGSRGRILLVEDDDANRTILGEFLRTRGFAVDEVSTGAEAVVRAASTPPDLVVLDIQLPGMDGFEVLARLRAGGGSAPPVLALTALAMSGDRERILKAGADAYLAKPAPLATLDVEIDRLLRESRR